MTIESTLVSCRRTTALETLPMPLVNYKMGVVTPAFYTVHRNFRGEFIVPPGRMFATHVIANVVGETFTMSIGWHEKQLTLG